MMLRKSKSHEGGPAGLTELTFTGAASEEYTFFGGKRVARRDGTGHTVHYYFSDHLGSTDLITGTDGGINKTSAYYPYGGEISVTGPTFANTYKFNGKERDAESGLDYFGARHYASPMGRWMVPDWAAKPTDVPYANFGNPQSLNLYSYVQNNPTTTGDPDGHQEVQILQVIDWVADTPEGQAAVDWGTNAVAAAGTLLGTAAAAAGNGQLGNAYPSYYHPVDNPNPFFQNGNTQAGQSSQSTPAQPPGGGNDDYDKNSPENKKRMDQGKPPIGKDGKPIELHHDGQTQNGEQKEMTRTDHRLGDNFKKNHPNTGQEPSKIDRNQAAKARRQHWKDKANDQQ